MYFQAGGGGKGNIRPNQHQQQQPPQHHLQHHHQQQQQQQQQQQSHQLQHLYPQQSQQQHQHHHHPHQQQQDQQVSQLQLHHSLQPLPQATTQYYNSLQIAHQHNTHQQQQQSQQQSQQQQNGIQPQVAQSPQPQPTPQSTVSSSTSSSSTSIALGINSRQNMQQQQQQQPQQTNMAPAQHPFAASVHHQSATAIMPYMTAFMPQYHRQAATVAVAASATAQYCPTMPPQAATQPHHVAAASSHAAAVYASQQPHSHSHQTPPPPALHQQQQQHQQTQMHHPQGPPPPQAQFYSTAHHYTHGHQQQHIRGVPQSTGMPTPHRLLLPPNALFALPAPLSATARSANHIIAAQHSAAVPVPPLLQPPSQSRGGGGGAGGPHHYTTSSFCQSPLAMTTGATAILGQTPPPSSMLSTPAVAASASSLSLQGYVPSGSSVGTIKPPRKHAIPIIDPKTLEGKLKPPTTIASETNVTENATDANAAASASTVAVGAATAASAGAASVANATDAGVSIAKDDKKSINALDSDLEGPTTTSSMMSNINPSDSNEDGSDLHILLNQQVSSTAVISLKKVKIDQQMQTDSIKDTMPQCVPADDIDDDDDAEDDETAVASEDLEVSQIEEEHITVVEEAEEELEDQNICCNDVDVDADDNHVKPSIVKEQQIVNNEEKQQTEQQHNIEEYIDENHPQDDVIARNDMNQSKENIGDENSKISKDEEENFEEEKQLTFPQNATAAVETPIATLSTTTTKSGHSKVKVSLGPYSVSSSITLPTVFSTKSSPEKSPQIDIGNSISMTAPLSQQPSSSTSTPTHNNKQMAANKNTIPNNSGNSLKKQKKNKRATKESQKKLKIVETPMPANRSNRNNSNSNNNNNNSNINHQTKSTNISINVNNNNNNSHNNNSTNILTDLPRTKTGTENVTITNFIAVCEKDTEAPSNFNNNVEDHPGSISIITNAEIERELGPDDDNCSKARDLISTQLTEEFPKGTPQRSQTLDSRSKRKTHEIVSEFLQNDNEPTDIVAICRNFENDQQEHNELLFLNSSASVCEDDDNNTAAATTSLPQSSDDHILNEKSEILFGDFHEDSPGASSPITTTTLTTNHDKTSNVGVVDRNERVNYNSLSAHTVSKSPLNSVKKMPLKNRGPFKYTMKELRDLADSKHSRATPMISIPKGDCIGQLFVPRQGHHNQQQHYQHHNHHQHAQMYQQISFNESMEYVTGKRRLNKKHHDALHLHHHHQQQQHQQQQQQNQQLQQQQQQQSQQQSGGSTSASSLRKMEVIRINLSLNEDIKLSECANAWMPTNLRKRSPTGVGTINKNEDIEVLLMKFRGILNKLTPENFDTLLKSISSYSINTTEKMQQVMLLIFEKTVSEPNFATTYARFCKHIFQDFINDGKNIFTTSLISRIQYEFESSVNCADAKKLMLQPIVDKIAQTTDAKERSELTAELEEKEYQFRRRAWGTVRFIGEMYKLNSLNADRVLMCIESLLQQMSEEKLEYMCKLLTTVGHLIDGADVNEERKTRMNMIFKNMQDIVKNKGTTKTGSKMSSRVRFMMQDVIDLRSRLWDQPQLAQMRQTQQQQLQQQQSGGRTSMSSTTPIDNRSSQSQRQQQMQHGNSNFLSSSSSSSTASSNMNMPMSHHHQHNMRSGGNRRPSQSPDIGGYYPQNSKKIQSNCNNSASTMSQQQQQPIDFNKLPISQSKLDDTTSKLGNPTNYMWRVAGKTSPLNSGTTQSTASSSSGIMSASSTSSSSSKSTCYYRQEQSQKPQYSAPQQQMSRNSILKRNEEGNSLPSGHEAKESDLIKSLITAAIENNTHETYIEQWDLIPQRRHEDVVFNLFNEYLHRSEVKKMQRNIAAQVFAYLLKGEEHLLYTDFENAYNRFSETIDDMLVDVPNAWAYIFEFLGPLLHADILKFSTIWKVEWRDQQPLASKFVKELVMYFTTEYGANYMRYLWNDKFNLRYKNFMNETAVTGFIAQNDLQFIQNENVMPPKNFGRKLTPDEITNRIDALLKESKPSDMVIDYICTNVNIDTTFIRHLTKFLCDYAVILTAKTTTAATTSAGVASANGENKDDTNISPRYRLCPEQFVNICIPVLRRCIDSDELFETTCLDTVVEAMQLKIETPSEANDLICNILNDLYELEVISKESLNNWYTKQDLLTKGIDTFLEKLLME